MLFVIEGKTPDHHDRTLRIEAESSAQAEAIGWARGIFVTSVTAAEEADLLETASERVMRWMGAALRRLTPGSMRLWGRPVSGAQSFAFVVGGMATWVLDLHAFHFV